MAAAHRKGKGEDALNAWLESIDLGSLTSTLVSEGYSSIESARLITEKDLKEMNVKRGHAARFLSAIAGASISEEGSAVVPSASSLPAAGVSSAPSLPPASAGGAAADSDFSKPAYAPPKGDDEVELLLKQLKESLESHGAVGIVSLGRKFRIMDDDHSNSLDYDEFRKALGEHAFDLSDTQLRKVFKYFDQDGNNSISYDEFLVGIRGQLNDRRKALVLMAFDVLDLDRSGIITLDEIVKCYNCDKHPEVISGKKTKGQVFREFLDTFDGGEKDGQVTPEEFCRYYSNVSSSIDSDDYFELMIRNAWHLSGGKGAYENTTCRRVLATHTDGRQSVLEIKNDMFIAKDDIAGMMANLKAQGILDVVKISLSGMDSETPTGDEGAAKGKGSTRGTGGVADALGFSAPKSSPRSSPAKAAVPKAHHSKSR